MYEDKGLTSSWSVAASTKAPSCWSEAASSRNMNFSPSQELLSFSQSSCEPHQVRGSRLVSPEDLEDDTYSNDDYVDMASDTPEEDEQSLTGHYKHYSDFAPKHSTFGTG